MTFASKKCYFDKKSTKRVGIVFVYVKKKQ